MIDLKAYEVWFVTGSQHLYGPDVVEADKLLIHRKLLRTRKFTPHACPCDFQTCS